jgi:predicted nucleic acid-binding protein
MKFLIFDAGPLISLSLTGTIGILNQLKSKNIEFIITPQVRKEVIDRAITVKKYKLEAIEILDLIERGTIKESAEFVSDEELARETANISNITRRIITADGEKISLIQEGEASCLAFAKLCNCENLIAIDERTTRLISESIENLRSIMEKKLHLNLQINKKGLEEFSKFRFIRSSELVFIAFERGLIPLKKDKETLDALLYSLKFRGAAISSREIEEMKEMI